MTTVDRGRWLAHRIRYLEELLASDLPADQRSRAEAELAQLRVENRWFRRWFGRLLGFPG